MATTLTSWPCATTTPSLGIQRLRQRHLLQLEIIDGCAATDPVDAIEQHDQRESGLPGFPSPPQRSRRRRRCSWGILPGHHAG